jgi:hypothetical protein
MRGGGHQLELVVANLDLLVDVSRSRGVADDADVTDVTATRRVAVGGRAERIVRQNQFAAVGDVEAKSTVVVQRHARDGYRAGRGTSDTIIEVVAEGASIDRDIRGPQRHRKAIARVVVGRVHIL